MQIDGSTGVNQGCTCAGSLIADRWVITGPICAFPESDYWSIKDAGGDRERWREIWTDRMSVVVNEHQLVQHGKTSVLEPLNRHHTNSHPWVLPSTDDPYDSALKRYMLMLGLLFSTVRNLNL